MGTWDHNSEFVHEFVVGILDVFCAILAQGEHARPAPTVMNEEPATKPWQHAHEQATTPAYSAGGSALRPSWGGSGLTHRAAWGKIGRARPAQILHPPGFEKRIFIPRHQGYPDDPRRFQGRTLSFKTTNRIESTQ